jgi:hypothetical protein
MFSAALGSPKNNPLLNSHKSQMSGKPKKSAINYVFKTVYLQENKIEQYRKALEAKILIEPGDFQLKQAFERDWYLNNDKFLKGKLGRLTKC